MRYCIYVGGSQEQSRSLYGQAPEAAPEVDYESCGAFLPAAVQFEPADCRVDYEVQIQIRRNEPVRQVW